jgi:hypothetical protein
VIRAARIGGVLTAGLLALAGFAPPVASETPAPESRIYGGVPVPGDTRVVALSIFDGALFSRSCTGALWKPNLILTNAHCVTNIGSTSPVAGIVVFPPGSTAIRFANLLQGQSPARVVGQWVAPGYANTTTSVEPNDVAVLLLDQEIGPSAFTRLATTDEIARWTGQQVPVEHVGYGLIGPAQSTNVPQATSLPLIFFDPASRFGSVFRTAQSPSQGICSGDSGSPAFRVDPAGVFLLGVMAGGSAPCISAASVQFNNIGFTGMGYLPTLNESLRAAGRPTIPSAPQEITAAARNNGVVVRWKAPAISPETVVGYDVVDASGAAVCATDQTTCVVPNLPDGVYQFNVRSRNAENEGDAIPGGANAEVRAPQVMAAPVVRKVKDAPRITFQTLIGSTSAVVQAYVVRDGKGKRVCRVDLTTDRQRNARTLNCALPDRPGTYRFTVTGVTEMGNTPQSARSQPYRVR